MDVRESVYEGGSAGAEQAGQEAAGSGMESDTLCGVGQSGMGVLSRTEEMGTECAGRLDAVRRGRIMVAGGGDSPGQEGTETDTVEVTAVRGESMLQDILKDRHSECRQRGELQATWVRTSRQTSKRQKIREGEGCSAGRPDGEEGAEGSRVGTQAGGRILHGEPSRQPSVQAISGTVGPEGSCVEARGTLLCLRAHVPQADTHLDQHGAVGTEGGNGEWEVHGAGEVQDRQVEQGGEVGAQVQDGAGQPSGTRGKRKKGQEDDDAQGATDGAAASSDRKASHIEAVGQLNNSPVGQLNDSPRRELPKRRIIDKEGGRKVP